MKRSVQWLNFMEHTPLLGRPGQADRRLKRGRRHLFVYQRRIWFSFSCSLVRKSVCALAVLLAFVFTQLYLIYPVEFLIEFLTSELGGLWLSKPRLRGGTLEKSRWITRPWHLYVSQTDIVASTRDLT